MDTVLYLFLGIAAFGTLVALVIKGGSDDAHEEYDDDEYWRDV